MTADVLVVGAGAAGLACAWALRAAGRSVVVLEAGSRVGGRIRSYRTASGAAWELGAQVVHDRANPVWAQFELPGLEPFGDSDFRCLVAGRSRPLSVLAGLVRPPWMIVPALAAASPPLLGSPALWLANLPKSARRLGLDWLGQDWAGNPAGFEIPEMLEIASAPGALGDEAVVNGGWDQLTETLARGVEIRRSIPVRRISGGDGGVDAVTDTGVVSAGAVVITVPPWTIGGSGLVIENLPPEKVLAAGALRGGDAVVVVVSTSSVAPATASVFDADHGWGFFRAQQGYPDIQIVAKGLGAQRLRTVLGGADGLGRPVGTGSVDVPGSVAAALGAVLGLAFPWAAGAEIVNVGVADWGANPYVAGAFTTPGPGRSRHSATWARPWRNQIFFAGESTSGARGVGRVHGALASGLRAAEEVLTTSAVPDRAIARC